MTREPRFLVKYIAGEAAVYDRLSGDTHYLHPLACAVYALHSDPGGLGLEKLAQYLGRPVDDGLAADLRSTVTALQALGLISEREHAGF